MNADIALRLIAAELAVSMHEGRPATIENIMDATWAFYDFLTADLSEGEEGDEDDAAPDNAQTYAN